MRHPHPRLPLDNNRVTVSICSWDSLQSHHLCHGQKSRFLGDKLIPPLIGILIIGIYIYIKPYYWVDEFIPYYMENNGSLDARVLFFFRWFCFHLHSGNPRGLEGEINPHGKMPVFSSWWLNHPNCEKYARQMGSFPQGSG